MKQKSVNGYYLLIPVITVFILSQNISAQRPNGLAESEESFLGLYATLFVLTVFLMAAIVWWFRSRKQEQQKSAPKTISKRRNKVEAGALDADKELEWLRKNQDLVDKNRKRNIEKKKLTKLAEKADELSLAEKRNNSVTTEPGVLPVFSFEKLEPATEFSPLPISQDDALISAIEQAYDEYEEDETVRDLSLRVLMAFKTRNSVEALSQLALYDLSSSLRSKAVVTLTEFDHESVFETILLACADPTREVRAAAARGLTRLNFDRADAWARIIETKEPGRIRQAARAAIESGFVERSFDRLVHPDKQAAYESFVLLALLLRADETEQIFKALRTHRNMKVREAILHLFKVTKDENALNGLYSLMEDKLLPPEIKAGVDKTIEEIGLAVV